MFSRTTTTKMSTVPGQRMLQLMVAPIASITDHLRAFDVQVIHMPPEISVMSATTEFLTDSRASGEVRRVRLSRDLLPRGGVATLPVLYDEDLIHYGLKPLVIEGDIPRAAETHTQRRLRAVEYLTSKIVPEYERGVVSTVVIADEETIRLLSDYIIERSALARITPNYSVSKALTPGTTLWFESDGMLLRFVASTGP